MFVALKALGLVLIASVLPAPKPVELKPIPASFDERFAPVYSPAAYPSSVFYIATPWRVSV